MTPMDGHPVSHSRSRHCSPIKRVFRGSVWRNKLWLSRSRPEHLRLPVLNYLHLLFSTIILCTMRQLVALTLAPILHYWTIDPSKPLPMAFGILDCHLNQVSLALRKSSMSFRLRLPSLDLSVLNYSPTSVLPLLANDAINNIPKNKVSIQR